MREWEFKNRLISGNGWRPVSHSLVRSGGWGGIIDGQVYLRIEGNIHWLTGDFRTLTEKEDCTNSAGGDNRIHLSVSFNGIALLRLLVYIYICILLSHKVKSQNPVEATNLSVGVVIRRWILQPLLASVGNCLLFFEDARTIRVVRVSLSFSISIYSVTVQGDVFSKVARVKH